MLAITVQQPWASRIVAGVKQFETRPWAPTHLGPLLIHAARVNPGYLTADHPAVRACPDPRPVRLHILPRGMLIGMVEVIGCEACDQHIGVTALERSLGYWKPSNFAFHLARAVALPTPLPCIGQLGLWQVPPALPPRPSSAGAAMAQKSISRVRAC